MELQKNPFTVVNLLAFFFFFCIELFPKELETQAKLFNSSVKDNREIR